MSTPLTLHEESVKTRAQNQQSFADNKENIDNSQFQIIDYIHNEFIEAQRKNEKTFDEFKKENAQAHQYIIDCKEKDHCAIGLKIDRSIEAAVTSNQTGRRDLREAMDSFDIKFKDLSAELMNIKLRDATFYGKVVILTGLFSIGAVIFLTKFWETIINFLFKKS